MARDDEAEIISLQLSAANAALPSRTTTATSPLLPDTTVKQRMSNFPEEVYDLQPNSHLMRLMTTLMGDAGVGQSRKRLLMSRLQQVIQGIHFYDLDRFYGALFGVRRTVSEMFDFDPSTATATPEQWNSAHSKDASYRSRIIQFARSITYGATPTGMELVAEALLSVDCDVYESFVQADSAYQTHGEIQSQYATYAAMEGVSYGVLEGEGLPRLSGNERREFLVRPKRSISDSEAYELTRVLDRLKPADSRFTIEREGIAAYLPTKINQAVADSNFWEVTTTVTPTHEYITEYYEEYPPEVPEPIIPPKPPWVAGQSQQWSYATDVIGSSAYYAESLDWYDYNYGSNWFWNNYNYGYGYGYGYNDGGWYPNYWNDNWNYDRYGYNWGTYGYGYPYGRRVNYRGFIGNPTQRYYHDDYGWVNYDPYRSLMPAYQAEMRSLYGQITSNPYWGSARYNYPDLSPLYMGPFTVQSLEARFDDANDNTPSYNATSRHHHWRSPFRHWNDKGVEVLEYRFNEVKPINSVQFEVSHYPHRAEILAGDDDGNWYLIGASETRHSVPEEYYEDYEDDGDMHDHPGHWKHEEFKFETPVLTSRLRINLIRIEGRWPIRRYRSWSYYNSWRWRWNRYYDNSYWGNNYGWWRNGWWIGYMPYTLAVRNVDVGYSVRSIADLPKPKVPATPTIIAVTKDIVGSKTEYSLRQERAFDMVENLVDQWKCEPQPVSYAVVNFYLDLTDDTGGAQVIDRFYLEPTHPGPHLTLYYTNDDLTTSSDNTDAYNEATWTPILRDYTLQKGYVQVPPTLAKHFKFEFTALTAEPFNSVLPITRRIRLFPESVVQSFLGGTGTLANPPAGITATQDVPAPAYRDAEIALRNATEEDRTYSPTEAVVASDPAAAVALRKESWAFGFQPWHQGGRAPRFDTVGKHSYSTLEINHVNKVGYSVGLSDVRAYRQDFGADDDTQVYFEQFNDFVNIKPGFTFTFNTGAMTTETSYSCEAQSTLMASLRRVKALQFATQQTPAIQIVPDDDFRDPYNDIRNWDDPDAWHRTGDATVAYSSTDHSVIVSRHQGATGGIETPQVGVANDGRVHAAVRATLTQAYTSPWLLQIVSGDGTTLLASKKLTGGSGTTIEAYVSLDLTGDSSVRARVVQAGNTTESIRVDTLSVFDEGIVWDFSVNGGVTWHRGNPVRNNANGVITFPEPGNQLVWRVRGLRPYLAVSAVKIRPQYVGVQDARYNGAQRGPNVSTYDQDVPIQDDPMFTDWTAPIPKGWFTAYKRFPTLPVEGAPNVTEFARFYGRPVNDAHGAVTDVTTRLHKHVRTGTERMDFFQPLTESAQQQIKRVRTTADTVATPTSTAAGHIAEIFPRTTADTASATDGTVTFKVFKAGGIVNRVVHPVYNAHPAG